jgi:hypothetical protein
MTAVNRVVQAMDTLVASVRQEWPELAAATLSKGERMELRRHIALCFRELTKLQTLSSVPANASGDRRARP